MRLEDELISPGRTRTSTHSTRSPIALNKTWPESPSTAVDSAHVADLEVIEGTTLQPSVNSPRIRLAQARRGLQVNSSRKPHTQRYGLQESASMSQVDY